MITGQPDTDSDRDVYSQRLGPSAESLNSGRSSAPNLSDSGASQYTTGSDPYPAWGAERNIPLSKEEIEGQKNAWLSKIPYVEYGAFRKLRAIPSAGACIFIATLVRFHDPPA
jgi:hypothetical protein